MAKRTCPKGHIYDSTIYGDNCPFCPSGAGTAVNDNNIYGNETVGNFGNGTEVNQTGDGKTQVNGRTQFNGTASGPTVAMGGNNNNCTVIRRADVSVETPSGKRIMGLLITYDTNPTGQVFSIYEGRNYIGRDMTSDVNIQGDTQVSVKHLSIMYRAADGKFKFKDEQSSNGTYLNEVLTDEGELATFDVIRIGSTKLIFIAIPQIQ